ncbi:MAG: tetratricopeptide repeat protein [Chloroflexota bacterium]
MTTNRFEIAAPPTRRAGSAAPPSAPSDTSVRLQRALLDFQAGRAFEAEAACRRILQQRPHDSDALHLLARIMRQAGRSDLAAALLRKALRAAPDSVPLRRTLAGALLDSGQPQEASAECRAGLAIRPDDVRLLTILAVALQAEGTFDEALAVLDRALTVTPDDRRASFHRVNCLHALGETDAAHETYARLCAKDGWHRQAHALWAKRLVRHERHREARHALEIGLSLTPDDPVLSFALASLGGVPTPSRAPDAYLIQHFDTLAETFDESLVDRLEYAVPRLLAEEARRAWGGRDRQPDVLDLGCGTGLCGVEVRPFARRLVGIDLSPGMLEQARARGIYDELHEAELTSALADVPESFDLILAGDVLTYFGDLRPVLTGVAGALRPGGLLVLSVEQLQAGDVHLHDGGRYAHSPRYLREATRAAGLHEVTMRECTVRLERGEPVAGCVGVFRR